MSRTLGIDHADFILSIEEEFGIRIPDDQHLWFEEYFKKQGLNYNGDFQVHVYASYIEFLVEQQNPSEMKDVSQRTIKILSECFNIPMNEIHGDLYFYRDLKLD